MDRAGVLINGRRTARSPPGVAVTRTKPPTDGVTPIPALADVVTHVPDGVTPVPLRGSKAEGAGGACRGSGGLVVV